MLYPTLYLHFFCTASYVFILVLLLYTRDRQRKITFGLPWSEKETLKLYWLQYREYIISQDKVAKGLLAGSISKIISNSFQSLPIFFLQKRNWNACKRANKNRSGQGMQRSQFFNLIVVRGCLIRIPRPWARLRYNSVDNFDSNFSINVGDEFLNKQLRYGAFFAMPRSH